MHARSLLVIALSVAAASCASAASRGAANDGPRFEKLKALAGDWVAKGASEAPEGTKVTYRVTSGGSAVVETEFAGTPHEMVTVYTLDGGRLTMTHYCALANQPHMVAQPEERPDVLTFVCDRLGNGRIDTDMHMHRGEITFVDSNHVTSAWTLWKDGAQGDTVHIALERSGG